jgi:hypothetical protein
MMPGELEAAKRVSFREEGLDSTDSQLRNVTTLFTLDVVVMRSGSAPHEPHGVIRTEH